MLDCGPYLFWVALTKRLVFHTRKSWLGIRPITMQTGHIIVVIHSVEIPFILRPISDRPDCYRLIGECYIDILSDEGAYAMIGEGVKERVFS